jgi:hypothetical protein
MHICILWLLFIMPCTAMLVLLGFAWCYFFSSFHVSELTASFLVSSWAGCNCLLFTCWLISWADSYYYCTQFEWYHEQTFTVDSTICAVGCIFFIVTYVTQLLNGMCPCSVHFQHLVNYHIYLTVRSEFFPDFICEKWWSPCNPALSSVCSV